MENKHSVLNADIKTDGIRRIDLTSSPKSQDGLIDPSELHTLSISDNPYYYSDMIRFTADGPIMVSIPLPRFMRYMVDIYGYEAVKKAVDEFPQELRYKTFGGQRND